MNKKELMRILKNLCNENNWCIIKPSLFISNSKTVLIVDVYEKKFGSIYHVYVDAEKHYFTSQFLSPFDVQPSMRNSLDRFM